MKIQAKQDPAAPLAQAGREASQAWAAPQEQAAWQARHRAEAAKAAKDHAKSPPIVQAPNQNAAFEHAMQASAE